MNNFKESGTISGNETKKQTPEIKASNLQKGFLINFPEEIFTHYVRISVKHCSAWK